VIGIQAIVRDITQRKSLERNLEERTKELKALYDTTRQVATSLNLDEVLTTIAQSSANLLKVDGAIIRLLDAEHKILKVVKAHNLKTDSPALGVQRVGEGVLARVLLKGKPIAVEDVQKDPRYLRKEWAKKEGFISFLGVPLESKEKIVGTLSFLSRRRRIFQKEEISLASIFADEAAVAIENTRLVGNLQKQIKQMKAVSQAVRRVVTSLDFDSVLDSVLRNSALLFGADAALIRLLDSEKEILKISRTYNLDRAELGDIELGEGITSEVVLKREPIVVEDIAKEPRFFHKGWAIERGYSTGLFVPLQGKKGVIGVLSVLSKKARRFDEEEISLASIFAGEAAVAIENAKLYEEAKRSLLERKKLHEISVAASSKLDTSSILKLIAESALELTKAKRATIRLLTRDKKKVEKALYASSDPKFSYPPAKLKNDGLDWRTVKEKRPMVARTDTPTSSLIRDRGLKMGIKTLASFPLMEEGDVVGTLVVSSTLPDAFAEEEIKTLSVLSYQAAVVLKSARLFEENVKFSVTDPLTGIYNSRYFYDGLRREINRTTRYGGTTSVIMFDLDGFKNYNDLYGHQAGDYVLREVAQRMLRYCRQTDILARYGGDEFVILLPQTDQRGCIKLGERIRLGLEEGLFAGKRGELRCKVTVSGSVITSPQDGDEVEDLMRKLDILLYVAKWMGENRVYSPSTISLQFIQDQLLERVDQKDHYTRQHSERVSEYATTLARKMNLDKEQIEVIRISSLVHDVGKIGIPEVTLNKPGELDEQERSLIRAYPRNSAKIIRLSPLPREIIPLILHHHERWDGTGYPQGLKGEEIPLGARIIGLADAYDAMSVERPYRGSLKPQEVVEEIKKLAGSQFDPTLVEIFAKTISPKSQYFPKRI
ncbi:diguanylate cyclase, partial [Candidatus Aerophobetes bacterium]